MSNSHEDSQSDVSDLFSKLDSWMEESRRQFCTIINSHNRSITMGVDNLVEEVGRLKNELSAVKNEKNVLIETVNCLNGEIRRYSARAHETKKSHDTQTIDGSKIESPVKTEEDIFEPEIHKELYSEELNNDGDIAEMLVNQEKNLNNYRSNLNDSSNTESQVTQEGTVNDSGDSTVSDESVCPECNFVFSTGDNMRIHIDNVHSKVEQSEVLQREDNNKSNPSNNSRGEAKKALKNETKFKCEKCPKVMSKNNLKRHVKAVHDKMRNHVCEECGHAASLKVHLKNHMAWVHNAMWGRSLGVTSALINQLTREICCNT